jgi:hypothetical protein
MDLHETRLSDGTHGSPKLPEGKKNFLIDIDGTICEDIPNEQPERMPGATPILGARDTVNEWFNEGHIITFFTSRTEAHREVTEAWLQKHDFRYHGLLMGKPRGGNYHWIDDRTVEATQFNGTWSPLVKKMIESEVFEDVA